MSLHEEVDMLKRIPLFAQIEPPKLKLIAFTSERVAFDAGHTLFRQGDAANAAYVIVEGKAEVIVETAGGGGYGEATGRARAQVESDVRNGKVSPETARGIYGLGNRP